VRLTSSRASHFDKEQMKGGFETLWDGFDKVCDKAEKGEEFTKTVIKYMERRQEAEAKYASNLAKMSNIFSDREDAYVFRVWMHCVLN
jgi:hypothetical protein